MEKWILEDKSKVLIKTGSLKQGKNKFKAVISLLSFFETMQISDTFLLLILEACCFFRFHFVIQFYFCFHLMKNLNILFRQNHNILSSKNDQFHN